jgi:hypothetical protein
LPAQVAQDHAVGRLKDKEKGMRLPRVLSVLMMVLVLPLCMAAGCGLQGCLGPDGGGNPTGGGPGIPEGTYSGPVTCTETTSAVQNQQETVLDTSTQTQDLTQGFGANGVLLGTNNQPLTVGSQISVEVAGATATATVNSIDTPTDGLVIVSDASVTVDVPERGTRAMIGIVSVIYGFSEPDTVSVSTQDVFTSDVVDGEFIKVVLTCSGNLTTTFVP